MRNLSNITAEDQEVILFEGKPTMTFSMVDKSQGWPKGTTERIFAENSDELVEGVHYIIVDVDSPYES